MVVVMVVSQEMALAPVDEETEEAEEKLSLVICMAIINKMVGQKMRQPQLFLLLALHHSHHHGWSPKYHHEKEGGSKQELRPLIPSFPSLRFRLHRKHVGILIRESYSPKKKSNVI